ncbi:hypothetical protein HPT25_16425 [Bacillus sp. BRMEA1]|uniref:hypothetical protein n=1 Tax=Neobacillus endophyticus TaxID=2738405 RepID=UPI001564AD43|nr:hypothetical protein [Neobacillus endophyticus]NRD78951.1 hypothetical protein [Neobacillus endophyticus]
MVGLFISIVIFNLIALKIKKQLTRSQMLQIWLFSSFLQILFDVFVDVKYQGYWYFSKDIDWQALFVYLFIVPTVNIIFLNKFPFQTKRVKQVFYIFTFNVFILIYELVVLLPEPWGYFHYGWWNIGYSAILNPFLVLILLGFFKIVCRLEEQSITS